MPAEHSSCAATDLDSIERSFPHNKRVSEQYEEAAALERVAELIPASVKEKSGGMLVPALLNWFKNDFMRWLPNESRCANCDGQIMQRTIKPGESWQLRKTELYRCERCGFERIYPRYSDVTKIAETRIGRCGEWSILFGAVLCAASVKARIVHDYLDHCWNEALLGGRWVHIDSTLQLPTSLDHPHHYEQNWGKKYTYVLAFEPSQIQDVTQRYTEQYDTVLARRKQLFGDESLSARNRMSEGSLQELYSSIQTGA